MYKQLVRYYFLTSLFYFYPDPLAAPTFPSYSSSLESSLSWTMIGKLLRDKTEPAGEHKNLLDHGWLLKPRFSVY